jgi:hypothetical protein
VKLIILLATFISYNIAFAAKCPPGTTPIEVNVPSTGKQINFCQISIDGKLLKHGPEKIYSTEGTLIQTRYFVLGKKSTAKALMNYVNQKGFPKSTTGPKNSIPPMAVEAVTVLFKAIMPFMRDEGRSRKFNVRGCKNYQKEWVEVFLTNRRQDFKYNFQRGCDIQGVIKALPGRKVKMDLRLRNVGVFERTELDISYFMKLNLITRVDFVINDGTFYAKGEGDTRFTGDYSVDLNPMKKTLIEKNRGGTLKFIKVFGKEIKLQRKFMVN